MQNKKTLFIFPLITQLIVSLIAIFMGDFSVNTLQTVFIVTTLPAFLLALVCLKFNYHQQHLFPIAFFSGLIGFFYSLCIMIYDINRESLPKVESLWEYSLMLTLFALAYSCASILYSLLILRPFLRKRLTD